MSYVIVSTTVTDDITLASGHKIGKKLGGAGTYALSGAKVWSDDVILIAKTGQDYNDLYGSWYDKNNLSKEGITVACEKTPVSVIQYYDDGERIETPLYGFEHYVSLEATPEDIEPFCKDAKGVYIFKGAEPEYFEKILGYKDKYGFKLLWELNASFALPEYIDVIKSITSRLDIFSLNITEVCNMFSVCDPKLAVERLKCLNVPFIYLRMGAKGALMLEGDKVYEIPPVSGITAVDVTGGGNSSSAAVLCGICEGLSPLQAGIMGSISASVCIAQFSVPDLIDEKVRNKAKDLLNQMVYSTPSTK